MADHSGRHFKICILAPLTNHACGASRFAAMLRAIHDVNNKNATYSPVAADLGFRLHYRLEDTENTWDGAIRAFKKLQSDPECIVVIGPNSSGSSKSLREHIRGTGLAVLSYAATASELGVKEMYPYFHSVVHVDRLTAFGMAHIARRLGYSEVVGVFTREPYSEGFQRDFHQQAAEHGLTLRTLDEPLPAISDDQPPSDARIRHHLLELQERFTPHSRTLVVMVAQARYTSAILRQASLLPSYEYPNVVWLGADVVAGGAAAGLPGAQIAHFRGVISLKPLLTGPSWPAWEEEWPATVGSAGPALVPFGSEWRHEWTTDANVCTYTTTAYDAIMQAGIALNMSLQRNREVTRESVAILLSRVPEFAGLSGNVSRDAKYGRIVDLVLCQHNDSFTPKELATFTFPPPAVTWTAVPVGGEESIRATTPDGGGGDAGAAPPLAYFAMGGIIALICLLFFAAHWRHLKAAVSRCIYGPVRRLALVICVAEYDHYVRLPGVVEDAGLMRSLLCTLGINSADSVVSHRNGKVPMEKFRKHVEDFLNIVEMVGERQNVLAFVVFSCHGLQCEGDLYPHLYASDASPEAADDPSNMKSTLFNPYEEIFSKLKELGMGSDDRGRLQVISVYDCCRVRRSLDTLSSSAAPSDCGDSGVGKGDRSLQGGPVSPTGSLKGIPARYGGTRTDFYEMFATYPGDRALATPTGSILIKELAEELKKEPRPIDRVFHRVAARIEKKGGERPWGCGTTGVKQPILANW